MIIRTSSKDRGKDKKKDQNNDDGGLAEADPEHPDDDESWLAPVEISDPNIEWNRLYLSFTLTEDAVWIGGEPGKSHRRAFLSAGSRPGISGRLHAGG